MATWTNNNSYNKLTVNNGERNGGFCETFCLFGRFINIRSRELQSVPQPADKVSYATRYMTIGSGQQRRDLIRQPAELQIQALVVRPSVA